MTIINKLSPWYPSLTIAGNSMLNAADCGWFGARGHQPLSANACKSCYWTTAGKQAVRQTKSHSWQQRTQHLNDAGYDQQPGPSTTSSSPGCKHCSVDSPGLRSVSKSPAIFRTKPGPASAGKPPQESPFQLHVISKSLSHISL